MKELKAETKLWLLGYLIMGKLFWKQQYLTLGEDRADTGAF